MHIQLSISPHCPSFLINALLVGVNKHIHSGPKRLTAHSDSNQQKVKMQFRPWTFLWWAPSIYIQIKRIMSVFKEIKYYCNVIRKHYVCLHWRVCQLCGCGVCLFWCLLLYLCPIWCAEAPDRGRAVTAQNPFMSQHMLITFWALKESGLKACFHRQNNWLNST